MDRVSQEWLNIDGQRYLVFQFQGNLTDEVAKVAIEEWTQHFQTKLPPGEKANIVWNCLEMKKYSAGAALSWKNTLPKFSSQIEDIWLITTNPFFKMGAKTVTMLTNFKLNLASSHEQFVQEAEAVALS